jgi:uncharacterized protein
MTAMFVNLPATNLERAKAFYTPIGFTVNPAMSDHNGVCVMVEEGHSYFMILTREYLQTFTDLPLGDPAVSPSVSTAIFLDSGRRSGHRRHCRGRCGAASRNGLRLQYQRQLKTPTATSWSSAGWTRSPPRRPRP